MALVYATIAISWQLLRFNSLKKHFPQIYRFKRFETGLEKKFPNLKFFPWFWLKSPCFSLISLTGKSLQNFPWIPRFPWSVGTLLTRLRCLLLSEYIQRLSVVCLILDGSVVCVPSAAVAVCLGGGVWQGGCLPGWQCLPGRCLTRGCLPMGVSVRGVYPPSRGQNSWHMLVKTVPFRNFVCGR